MTTILLKADYAYLCEEIKKEFEDFEIIKKSESSLMKLINVLLTVISFGKMKVFMTDFITVIGNKVYVPDSWDERSEISKCVTLRHERVHMRQSRQYGKVLFTILYLFVPLPVGLAWYRAKFEKEAYEVSFRALKDYLGYDIFSNEEFYSTYKQHAVSNFTSAHYFWMWPFKKSIEVWFDKAIKD